MHGVTRTKEFLVHHSLALAEAARRLEAAATAVANEFVRSHALGKGPDDHDRMREADAFQQASDVVRLTAAAVAGSENKGPSPVDIVERGALTALSGRPVAEAVDWLRALERVVADHFLASSQVELGATREGMARIARLFDNLCSEQLESYSNTYDELSGWYNRVGTDLLSCLVSGAPVEPAVVNSQARILNINPHQPYRAVALQHEAGVSPQRWAQLRRRLAALFLKYDPQRSVLVRERNGLLLAVVPTEGTSASIIEMLRDLLKDEEICRTLYVATGEPTDDLAVAGRSCRQALSALEIAIYRGQRGQVTQCTEVILEVLLAHNHWVSRRIINSRLGALVDKPHLLETLRAYINCDMALQRTAEELVVHPNTVAYRLRQIASLTGREMRRVVDLADLMVALTALDVVLMRHDQEEGRVDLRAQLLSTPPTGVASSIS
jgi:hypothetical protein